VPAHQNWSVVDESRFRSVSVWVALTDCTVDNGTLLLADGSHRVLRGRRGMWAYTAFAAVEGPVAEDLLTPVEVRAGQAIVLDDATIHYSAPNRTDRPRLAIQYVMVPSDADALFFQQVGGDDERLEVDVWQVTPDFFFDFWHGDGDARHGEVVARIDVDNPRRDVAELRALLQAGAGR
jgi:ectoine hydroxylase-related dioxygenase (phytanoyl-CoA dioxygenase family)